MDFYLKQDNVTNKCMKLFLDSANKDEIKQALDSGLIDGVTTNPSLVAKSGESHEALIKDICRLVRKDVSAEVLAVTEDEMLQEAFRLARIDRAVVVKIPLIGEGLKVVKALSEEGVRTNVTLCFSVSQALLAAKAGATYVSVFMGRLDDKGQVGSQVAIQSHKMIEQYGFKTQVLGASVRHVLHVTDLAQAGVPACTLPFKVFNQLILHPLTDSGLEKFLQDAKKN